MEKWGDALHSDRKNEKINRRKDYNVYDNYNKLHLIIIILFCFRERANKRAGERTKKNMNVMNVFNRLK